MLLNRLAKPTDWGPRLTSPPELVNHHPLVTAHTLQGQDPARVWEYSLALDALDEWKRRPRPWVPMNPVIADIGGAGSNFWQLFSHYTNKPSYRIDPNHEAGANGESIAFRQTLTEYMREEGKPFDVVFCISVIEHVPDEHVDDFGDALIRLVRSGGLLFLTTDVGEEQEDHYHFHWMRHRIYTPRTLGMVGDYLCESGFSRFGELDYTYRGPTVYDYTFGSLAVVKD